MEDCVGDKTVKHLSNKDNTKLKFGIEALLSSSDKTKHTIDGVLGNNLSKPLPTMTIPCSDCVTSLFRCCRLNTATGGSSCGGGGGGGVHQDSLSASGFHSYASNPHPMDLYTIQPIRPFATRPGNFSAFVLVLKEVRVYYHNILHISFRKK